MTKPQCDCLACQVRRVVEAEILKQEVCDLEEMASNVMHVAAWLISHMPTYEERLQLGSQCIRNFAFAIEQMSGGSPKADEIGPSPSPWHH